MYVIVRGLVQGVGYRYFVERQANSLQLVGYVKNLVNGDVEVFAQGDRGTLEELLAALRVGPRSAQVRETKVIWKNMAPKYERFEVAF